MSPQDWAPAPDRLPPGLRDRVLEASWLARAGGSSYPDVDEIEPTEAFSRAADSVNALLHALDDADWPVPVLRDLSVQGLVGHLIAVEADFQRAVVGDPEVAAADHITTTQATAQRQTTRRPATTRADWRREANRALALVETDGDLSTPVAMHGLQTSLGALLVIRAFELWTHENDIRAAVGRPPSVPDPSTLRLMTALAARALPVGADRIGLRAATDVRLVLTGTGGGTWDVTLGSATTPRRLPFAS